MVIRCHHILRAGDDSLIKKELELYVLKTATVISIFFLLLICGLLSVIILYTYCFLHISFFYDKNCPQVGFGLTNL